MMEYASGGPLKESYDEISTELDSTCITESSDETTSVNRSFKQESSFLKLNDVLHQSSSKGDEKFDEALNQSYGFPSVEELVESSFNKKYSFTHSSQGARVKRGEAQFYKTEIWNVSHFFDLYW